MKKALLAILLCFILVVSFAACGASSSDKAAPNGMSVAEDAFLYSAEQEIGAADINGGAITSDSGAATAGKGNSSVEEKIVKTVDLTVQTKDYDAYLAALTKSVSTLGGYIENAKNSMGSYYYESNRNSSYIVRIPSAKLDEFLAGAESNGKITSKTETQKNVTLEYVDLESRISAYKTEQKTLMGLLEKAESLEDVLTIQERLSEVNYQIDTYTAQLRVLENRVGYSTVTLNIEEVERVVEEEPSLGTEIKNRFLDNLEDLGDWLRDFVVDFIGGLPVIIPTVAFIAIVILILRKIIKKRRNKKNMK